MRKYMTKVQAEKLFKEEYGDWMKENRGDKIAFATAWNDFTDFLRADGNISEKQYNNWCHPQFCN